ncbi:MAG: FAD-dependent oxidoreductase, partial [Janthinobacterium lividum]
ITIIGAGALGLYTAYDLYERGYTNIIIVAEKFDSLTSHNAGGLLAPVSMKNEPEIQKVIDEVSIDAYRFYQMIALAKHPHFKEGAVIVPTYFASRADSGLEPYVGVVMQPAKDVVLDFGNGTKHAMVAYDDGIFIDTTEMMESLNTYARNKNIKFIQKKVISFGGINTKYIINCSGMGAKELSHDKI